VKDRLKAKAKTANLKGIVPFYTCINRANTFPIIFGERFVVEENQSGCLSSSILPKVVKNDKK
jgi:hypothetical protein